MPFSDLYTAIDPMIPSQFPTSRSPTPTPAPGPSATIKSSVQSSLFYTNPPKQAEPEPEPEPAPTTETPSFPGNDCEESTHGSWPRSTTSSHSSALSHTPNPTALHSFGNKISATVTAHPILATFLFVQVLFSGIPVCMFVVGALVSAVFAVAVFSCFAMLVLGPVVVGTTLVAVGVWGSGWVVYKVGGWAVRRFLIAEVNDEVEGIAEGGRVGMWHGEGVGGCL
ncbi:hypothetical protein BO94DRAFT_544806 [Aspergillus sclerotioniger CBS 115572]|uniref:Uncharacterized protein n=1 Tax=Aspergillus sclerotioniger CBS 115572 TaxID=1450535 RepID=A0A317X4D8_9EURO|nr:hypothetical protein BO94DRAFT_544806 [Aspergillus sclerotioniger CBS 115572]PWY91420.1 hypothetical protein BO94DRAFT_544806 [Aspergillus sclerotioniger CBS 115572]